ncbi:MAG: hypothetical protein MUE82_11045 [Chloroflexi bacterium]|jgi:hypothetical protein|nr:hypothetical protein [Chloroflexota bacterium]
MTRHVPARIVVAAAAALLTLAALLPVGASAAPPGGIGAAEDASPTPGAVASPSPTASLIPAGCPDVTDGRVSLETIIATGPAKMIECLTAAGVYQVAFDAHFPSATCDGCGGIAGGSITPEWLSGGPVDYDATSGAVTSARGLQPVGMRVSTGPEPALLGDDAATAWFDANVLDLRLPPGVGRCDTADTTAAGGCTIGRYADQTLRFTAHYQDPAASTCVASERLDDTTIPVSAVRTYCDQQLVVDSFVVTEPHVCPAGPYDVLQLSHFTSERLVACLGSRNITVTAYVPAPQPVGIGTIWAGKPGWLVDNGAVGMIVASGNLVGSVDWGVRIPPRLGACELVSNQPASCPFRPFGGKWVRIVGHFADPQWTTCKASWTSPAPRPRWFTTDYVRQYCREQFVLTAKPVAAKAPKAP